jgi:hypothetical protein
LRGEQRRRCHWTSRCSVPSWAHRRSPSSAAPPRPRQPIVGAFKAGRQLWPLALLLARAVLGGAAVAAESLDDYGVAGGGALRPAGCALLAAGMGLAIAMRAPYKVRRRTGCTRQDLSLPV